MSYDDDDYLWLLELLYWLLCAALELGLWDRGWRFLAYIAGCLGAARDWVEECIRERKIKEP